MLHIGIVASSAEGAALCYRTICVEGAELLVLRGGKSTLRRCRPKIFLEIEECWTISFGWTAADVVRFLREIGYQHFYGLGHQGLRIEEAASDACGILCTWEKIGGLA